jgi:hypothetical protein
MQKLPVYFAPTKSNQAVVRHLQGMPDLKFAQFLPLAEHHAERMEQLLKIQGRAFYIWGDGGKHHESYPFTKDCGICYKLNIDGHDDERSPKNVDNTRLSCGNHMGKSAEDGIRLIRPALRGLLGRELGIANMDFTHYTKELLSCGLTIDGDGIPGFPARPEWLSAHGVIAEKVIEMVRRNVAYLLRLDVGGFVEELPEFGLIEGRYLLPSYEVIEEFCLRFSCLPLLKGGLAIKLKEGAGHTVLGNPTQAMLEGIYPQVTQEVIDKMGSYVTWLYADLLRAFALQPTDVKYHFLDV